MPNVYFSHGTRNEQYLYEDLIIESISIWGQELLYIPRKLVAKDEILGEDRLSKFENAFPIDMYLETVDGFEGQGAFIQKFGLMMEQSATLTVARRTWERVVGRHGSTILPNRPCEGDLLYFPLTKGLFEIKFVDHQDPFYQLKKLYVYKLQVELFQYSSEHIDTGVAEIDVFETLKTFDTNTAINNTGRLKSISILDGGVNYTTVPTVSIISDSGSEAQAYAVIYQGKVISINITNAGTGYITEPIISIIGDSGYGAIAEASIEIDIDKASSFGDNNKFKLEASSIIDFTHTNPFGDVIDTNIAQNAKVDSSIITVDSTTTTTDMV